MGEILHITNGDSVGLRSSGLGGEVLAWKDVLHEGPVPAGLSLDELRPIRARFLAGFGVISEAEIFADLERRDRTLSRFAEFSAVVLWFEHDLYDQLQIIQILDWLSRAARREVDISLICGDAYLGTLQPAALADLYPTRRAVTEEQFALASRAWTAFRSRSPEPLVQLIAEDTGALPYLQGALLRHLQQFPSVEDGLSRSERQILEGAASGISKLSDLFVAVQAREERIFMGDSVFFWYVLRLAAAPGPLLTIAEEVRPFGASSVAITAAGMNVLDGTADAVHARGIDRWLGGVHLQNDRLWRWNDRERVLVATP